ncbi:hypothetical protein JHK85_022426 [Glycine max]|nr:hypothetical protein JHK85_022426 [Glycine max]
MGASLPSKEANLFKLIVAQMRDLSGFVETRQQLLTLKPNHRMNWIGFSVAHHLNSNASKAVEILEAYEGTLEEDHPPENERYYEGLQKCVGLYLEDGQYSPDQIDRLDSLYKTLVQQYKWSSAVKRIPLDFLQGDKFREAADNYIRPLLTKGVPSLFSDLSSLYNHPGKADILEQLILELERSIRMSGQYPGRMDKEPPSTLMWTLFLLAQHYDRRGQYEVALSKIDEAIEHTPTVIDLYSVKSRILKHAGDLVAAAAFADEARCMDLADRYVNSECVKRMLQADQVALAEKTAVLFTKDGDQHNNLHDMQCMWYELASGESYFRQGDLGRALKKFLAVEKHYADITEDQFDFHSYCLRKMTLCTYVEMLKFQDQLHSHAYFHKAAAGAIRTGDRSGHSKKANDFRPSENWPRTVLCGSLINWVMGVKSSSIIHTRGYIKLHDSPPKSTAEEDDNMSKLLPSQKKKMRQKQRKAEARAKKEAEEKNEESSASGVSKSGKRHIKPVDPDPNGEKLLQVEDPLSEATKYLKLLQKNSPDSLETHLLSFELYTRKQKILLALQAVKQLLRLDAEHPDSHRCLIKFFHKVGSMNASVTDSEKLIWSVLEAERPTISQLHEKSLFEANNSFLEKHKDSLMHRAAFAEILHILDSNRKSEAVKFIEESTNNIVPRNGALGPIREWNLKDCIAVHKLLGTVLADQDAALRWKVRCAEYFPYSTYFEGCHSSASPNSAFNQLRKNSENESPNHSVGGQNVGSITSNGKLEAFKDLTI